MTDTPDELTDTKKPTSEEGESATIKEMLKRFKLSEDAESDNRKKYIYSSKFALGGKYQWEDDLYSTRIADNLPCDTYNQIPQFVHQITNDGRINQTETKFIPGDDAMQETAEKREDLARNIQAGLEAKVAYDTALENAVIGGWGYWRYVTEYENDKTFDQIIKLRWVPNSLAIYDDPDTHRNDRLDRVYLFEASDIKMDEFKKGYEGDIDYNSTTLSGMGDAAMGWMNDDYIRIVEYWSVETSITKLYRKKDTDEITGEKPAEKTLANYDTRDVEVKKVIWRKCTACEVLEEREWPGKYIPYVYTPGEEKVIDGKKHILGLVEHMISPQKAFNYQSNNVTQLTALAPRSPWIAAVKSIKGFEKFWDFANLKNFAWLPWNHVDEKNNPNPQPTRVQAGTDIGANVALIQQAQQNMYNVSGIFPASLGKQGNESSGVAINARKQEGDVSTFHYVDNQTRGKLAGGIILDDLITVTYDGARVVTVMKEDGKIEKIKINQEVQKKNGEKVNYDMTKGAYEVMVTTGPSYTTKRQEQADAMLQLASQTNLLEVAPDIFYSVQDWPGAAKIAERYKKTLPPNLTEDEENPNPIPPQVTAQIQQMQQIIEQLQAALEKADQEVQSKEADIALKQQEIQAQAQENAVNMQNDAAKAENDRLKLELEQQKMDLEARKLEIEEQKVELEFYRARLELENPQPPTAVGKLGQSNPQSATTGGEDMGAQRDALIAKLQELDTQAAQQQADAENQAAFEAQEQEAQMIKEQQEQANQQMLLQSLAQIQQNLATLTMSIMAPKQIVRNPDTGLIEGVVTGGGQ